MKNQTSSTGLVSSLWAQRFKAECPTSYNEAIHRAGEPVDIYESDEMGESQWVVALEDGFWMDTFPSREEAENLVEEMGWEIIGSNEINAATAGDGTKDMDKPTQTTDSRDIVIRFTGEKCPECGGRMKACPVATWCENVKFKNGIADDSPCDNALLSG